VILKLDLHDEPRDVPEGSVRPQLRLVRFNPHVVFRRPEDPEVPWTVKVTGYILGFVVTGLALVVILFVAALLRELYHRIDEDDAARAAARAKQGISAPSTAGAPKGAITLTMPKETPPSKAKSSPSDTPPPR